MSSFDNNFFNQYCHHLYLNISFGYGSRSAIALRSHHHTIQNSLKELKFFSDFRFLS